MTKESRRRFLLTPVILFLAGCGKHECESEQLGIGKRILCLEDVRGETGTYTLQIEQGTLENPITRDEKKLSELADNWITVELTTSPVQRNMAKCTVRTWVKNQVIGYNYTPIRRINVNSENTLFVSFKNLHLEEIFFNNVNLLTKKTNQR